MGAYSDLQQEEFAAKADGFTAVRHQREAGTSCLDAVALTASGGTASPTAMAGSTEAEQFAGGAAAPAPAPRIDGVADGSGSAMPVHQRLPRDEDHDDGLVYGHAWAWSHA